MDDRKEGSDRNPALGLVFVARQSIHGFGEVNNVGELKETLLPQVQRGAMLIWVTREEEEQLSQLSRHV